MARRCRWVVTLLAGLLAGCSGGVLASLETGSVAGYVFVRDNTLVLRAVNEPAAGETAVSGAQLLMDTGTQATSDGHGYYHLHDVFAGTWNVTATYPGALPATVSVKVAAGTITYAGLGGDTANTSRKWTVMFYVAADNEREPAAVAAINALETVSFDDQIAVAVQMDRSAAYDTSSGDWSGARRFHIERDSDPTLMSSARSAPEGGTAVDLGTVDMADPANLQAMCNAAIATYPAAHYLLVVFGPGQGWRPSSRAVLYDGTGGSGSGAWLETSQLDTALQASRDFDLVAFDAPYLQTLEVDYQVKGRCAYVIGSQDALPDAGFPYARWLQLLAAKPSYTAGDLASQLVDATTAAYAGSQEVTTSAILTSQMTNVARKLEDLSEWLRGLSSEDQAILDARAATLRYGGSNELYDGYRDLGDLLSKLTDPVIDGTLTIKATALSTALASALVRLGHSGSSFTNSSGFSLYFPLAPDYLGAGTSGQDPTQTAYEDLALSGATHWETFLEEFLGRQ